MLIILVHVLPSLQTFYEPRALYSDRVVEDRLIPHNVVPILLLVYRQAIKIEDSILISVKDNMSDISSTFFFQLNKAGKS